MLEVVNTKNRESDGYFGSYSDAVEFGLTADEPFEIWQVADDENRTRMLRIYPRPTDIPRVYFAVPDHYTIGREFDTVNDAVNYARSTIEKIRGTNSYTRAFVDVRVSDTSGDKSVHRFEVFND
jgi:hypothetical protein